MSTKTNLLYNIHIRMRQMLLFPKKLASLAILFDFSTNIASDNQKLTFKEY